MTDIQREYVTLYEKGYGVREIARMLGKSPSVVCSGIKRAYQPKKERKGKTHVCRYSASCFTCPLPECRSSASDEYINLLPIGFDYVKAVEKEVNTG